MSQSRGNLGDNPELESTLEKVKEWYHIPALLLVLGFMLWNRVQNYANFIVDGEVLFSGQDPWYHFRSTMYVVQNWPATMPFDPWTYFPYGTRSGQFGTLLDQVVATVALIIGLGSPSEQTVAMVALFTPAVLGTLAAIPTYVIGRRLAGRLGGVTAIVILGLSSGLFMQRSVVGDYDHQVAEALLQVTSVLAVMVALSVAERDKPIYEQFLERDVGALRETVGYSVLAGVSMAFYLWTWPPAVLLLGILGTFFLLWLSLEFVRGKSPEHVAIAGAVMMGSVFVFELAVIRTFEITATDHSLLQPLLAFAIGAGCLFMAWLARYMEAESYDRNLYPVTVGGIIVTITVLMAILTPDLLNYFTDQVLRVVGFTSSPSATAATVGEAQPLRNPGRLYQYHGLALFAAVLGAALILFKQFVDKDAPAEQFLMVVWGAFILAASFTQIRFSLYLVFPVAVLSALFVGKVISWTDFSFDDGVEVYEALTIGAVVLIIVGTLVLVAPTAVAIGGSVGPGGSAVGWTESMDWVNENTPAEGAYGTGDNGSLEYYGTYQDREEYDYQTGEYGVLSWWDYGHIITVQGERIPNANPFQQGASHAANFLLAPDEEQANTVLDAEDEDDASTRYIAVDWQMANTYGQVSNGKFFAPTQFTDMNVSRTDYYGSIYSRQSTQQRFNYRTQAYYESMVTRLYEYHGSAMEPQPVVLDWDIETTQRGQQFRATPANGSTLRGFDSMAEAREYVENDGTSQVGGFGSQPSERVPALENYRYVGSSESSAYESGAYNRGTLIEAGFIGIPYSQAGNQSCSPGTTAMPVGGQNYCMANGAAQTMSSTHPTWTKIFERVPGGTIEGTAPANTTIVASVPMENEITGESFMYRQQAEVGPDGNFEMTVPYSSTGYEQWGTEEGYTNVSVRANGPYEFGVAIGSGSIPLNGTTHVSEGQVIGENETASSVTLTLDQANETANGTSADDGTTDDGTTDDGTTDDGSANETSTEETTTETATPSGAVAEPVVPAP